MTLAASAIVESDGVAALTLSRLAGELGVAAPSLYKHVAGLDDVVERVAARATGTLADALAGAVAGRSGLDALTRLAAAYRSFAVAHPGLYRLTQTGTRPSDGSVRSAEAARAVETVGAALSGYGLPDSRRVDAVRLVRSALHGFADLEVSGGFRLPDSAQDSFSVLVRGLDVALRDLAVRG